jgi:folylpolyglutamate synthase/dihydropteroate synthase
LTIGTTITVLSTIPYERAMSPGKLLDGLVRSGQKIIEVHVREDIHSAIDIWLSRIGEDDIGLALGSFYLYEFIKTREKTQKV